MNEHISVVISEDKFSRLYFRHLETDAPTNIDLSDIELKSYKLSNIAESSIILYGNTISIDNDTYNMIRSALVLNLTHKVKINGIVVNKDSTYLALFITVSEFSKEEIVESF